MSTPAANNDTVFDVAIAGSGLGGSTLACILARNGLRVLLVEAGVHPRFAVGESVVPEFGARTRIIADLFSVPEIGHMSNFQSVQHHISANSGVKRNFSFLFHRPGEPHRRAESCQFMTMTHPLGPDTHMYRPDLDTWLTATAIRYGATYRERTRVKAIEVDADGATLHCEPADGPPGGRETVHRARFFVDGTGYRSVLGKVFDLRPTNALHTDTRTIFTHMVGVRHMRDIQTGEARPRVPSPLDQGTLHHYFDSGWFWVIPFDNHRAAVNPLCSVGLTLDRRRHPDTDLDPEAEFFEWVDRFPTVKAQFDGARAVRGWVKTGRLQYQSQRIAGDRWCLLPHAAGFIDALFSSGMTTTMLGVQQIAHVVLQCFAKNEFRAEAFARVQQAAAANLDGADRMVDGAFRCFRSHALFNAWYRIWAVANYHGSAAMNRLHLKYSATRDRAWLERSLAAPYDQILGFGQPHVRAMLDRAHAIVCGLDANGEDATVEALFALLGEQQWIPPAFRVLDRERNHLASFTTFPLLGTIFWGKRKAPAEVRELLYDVGPVFFWELTKSLVREGARGAASFYRTVRDAHYSRGLS